MAAAPRSAPPWRYGPTIGTPERKPDAAARAVGIADGCSVKGLPAMTSSPVFGSYPPLAFQTRPFGPGLASAGAFDEPTLAHWSIRSGDAVAEVLCADGAVGSLA